MSQPDAGEQIAFLRNLQRLLAEGLRRPEYPELFAEQDQQAPDVKYAMEDLSLFTLHEFRKTHPDHYRYLRNEVYARDQHKDGSYVCARTGYKSRNQFEFEIDHKRPRAKGGLTVGGQSSLVPLRRFSQTKRLQVFQTKTQGLWRYGSALLAVRLRTFY